jgi:murein DD-endopeptidase MepM/ murein hydrolase activator NlpD
MCSIGAGDSTVTSTRTSFVAGPGPVTAGELIGISGTTGNSTGCHLHFEVRINADPINPRLWLTIH